MGSFLKAPMAKDDIFTLEERLRPHFASIGDTMARSQSRIVAATSLIRDYLTIVEITSLQVELTKRNLAKFQTE